MKKAVLKLLAVTLCIAMVFTVQPLTAVALPSWTSEQTETSEQTQTDSEPYIIREVEEKREENVKHFLMSDGSYMAAQYNIPVHFKDDTGSWQQYDNSLGEDLSLPDELVNQKSDTVVSFSKKAKQNKTVTLSTGGYEISWGFDKVNASSIEKTEAAETGSPDELSNIAGEAWYREVYSDVDLQYIILPYGVKENIVLKSASAQNEFLQNYKLGSLYAVQTDAQTVELKDAAGATVYVLQAPVMTDAAGNESEDVTLSVVKTNGNNITVRITADPQWLAAPEREFPVTVDPWVEKEGAFSHVADCYLAKASDGTVTPNPTARHIYAGITDEGTTRTYMKLQMPELQDGDVPTKALLTLTQLNGSNMGAGNYKVDIYKLTQDWTVNNVTFDHPHDPNVLDYCLVGTADGAYSWDFTRAAKEWYSSGGNYGLMIRGSKESGIVGRKFYGFSTTTAESNRPAVYLYYVNLTGLNDYNSYKTYDYGSYGTLSLNEYRGAITYTFPDVQYSGNLLNTNIYHVYNSDWAGTSTAYGKGWKLNISEKVRYVYGTEGLDSHCYFRYTDEDGTEIYFLKIDGTTNKHEDEVGRGYTLTYTNSGGDWTLTLEDKAGNKKGYDNDGRLKIVQDVYGNQMTFTYSGTGATDPVTSVTDSSGRVTTLTYNADGRLSRITDPAGRVVSYLYDSDGYLLGAERYDGIKPEFTMQNTRLYRVSLGDSDLVIKYHSNGECQSLATAPKDGDGNRFLYWERINGETRYITHLGPSESISAADRIYEVCIFNEWGQKITSYFKKPTGEIVSEVASAEYTSNSTASVKTNNKVERSYATTSAVNLLPDGSFEKGGSWNTIYWASHTDTAAYLGTETSSANAYIGQDYGRITFDAPSECTVSFYQNLTYLTEGETYTLSGYVKTDDLQGGSGAFLAASSYYTAGGHNGGVYSEYVLGTTERDVDNGWKRISVTFTVPSDISHVQLHAGIRAGAYGTVWFDCIQLEKGSEVSDYNLVENAGFEQSGSWLTYNAESGDGISGTQAFQDSGSYKMAGSHDTNKNISQIIDVYGSSDDVYILSGWAKASAVSDVIDAERRFVIECMIKYTDGSVKWPGPQYYDYFNTSWQYISVPVPVGYGDKQPQSITVYLEYYKNQNYCYFDNIRLIKDKTQSYVYDDDGNVVNAVSAADESSSFEYSDNEVVKSVASTGHKYYNTYSSTNKHLLISSYADGISYQYDHDGKGNVTGATALSSDIVDGGVYVFRAPFANRVMDLYNSETTDGTRIIMFRWNQTNNQRFRLRQVESTEYYTIHPLCAEDKVLEVLGGGTATGTKVCLATYTGATHQQFKFISNGKGTYRIIPRHLENKALTTWDTEGAGLEIWDNYENHDKGFILELLEETEDTLVTKSTATYTASGQYTDTVTDTLGNTVDYNYDETKGELTSAVDAKGNRTSYLNEYGSTNISTVIADTDSDGTLDEGEAFARYTSSKGLLRTVENNNNTYSFTYDIYGNRTKTSVGSYTLMDYIYNANNGRLNTVNYGNAHTMWYEYDSLNRVSEVWKQSPGVTHVFQYKYDKKGNLASLYEGSTDETTRYTYDSIGRLVSAVSSNGFERYQSYDAYNRINKLTFVRTTDSLTYRYNYNEKNLIGSVELPTGKTVSNTYDGLNRLVSTQINTASGLTSQYTYKDGIDGTTSSLVDTVTTAQGVFGYTYDAAGNILSITKNGVLLESYTYDSLNQLKTVTKGTDVYEYTYDNGGNILSIKLNDTVTDTYTYGDEQWKDKLTAYNGQSITYDEIGNPLQYRDGMSFTWKNGRALESLSDSSYNILYEYNADGIRVEKHITDKGTGTTESHYYDYNGTQLVAERWGSNIIWFLYDESGSAVGLTYNGTEYYYLKDLQGDITGIADASGNILAEYTYDVWGKLLSVTDAAGNEISADRAHIANINPLRYRGYYYDSETGLYYLLSRYYDPETGRFVNADTTNILTASPASANYDKNLFAYCDNNPVVRIDVDGEFWNTVIGIVAGAVVGGITAAVMGTNVWAGIASGATSGLILGATLDITIATGGTGLVALAAVTAGGAVGNGVGSYMNQRLNGTSHSKVDWGTVAIDTAWGALGGALSFGLADVGGKAVMSVSQILAQSQKRIAKQALDDFVTNVVTNIGTWLNGTKMNSDRHKNVDRRANAARRYDYLYR